MLVSLRRGVQSFESAEVKKQIKGGYYNVSSINEAAS